MPRNAGRLDLFYEKLKNVHKKYFPDFRFLQLMLDFIGWVMKNEKRDPFFIEEDRCLELLEEYIKKTGIFFDGWSLYPDERKTWKED